MSDFEIIFPEGFDDIAWEVTSKGWFPGVIAVIGGQRFRVMFYDPTRLAQDIESELKEDQVFFEPNLLVVSTVNRPEIEGAIAIIARTGRHSKMVPEP